MDRRTLANLRRKRLYIHKQLARYEPRVERLRASLEETNARIQAECPDLNLPPRFHKPNPIFARGELPRIVREIMWGQGPMAVRVVSLAALARKGVKLPGPGLMRKTRTRVRDILARWEKLEKATAVGHGKQTKRVLTESFTGC
jgi:hypothetical protein